MTALSVLIVDDEEEFAAALAERLELRGMETAWASSADRALDLLSERSFEVVLLDVKMPGTGGFEAARRIRERHPGTRVILLTGHSTADEREEGRRIGAVAYLLKPVDLEDLLETIERTAKERA